MTIKVTQEHIRNGKRSRSTECPVALAILESTGHYPQVFKTGVRLGRDWFYHTKATEEFINAFDSDRPVAPFEFDLPL